MKASTALLAGLLFSAGLMLGGMTQPGKVIGFLDVAGRWDPSLLLVMAGAVGVHFVFYRLVRRRGSPVFDDTFHVPTRRDIDPRLVAGAALFGAGWGLAGYCPGPALASLSRGGDAFVFVAAMLVGMAVHAAVDGLKRASAEATPPAHATPGVFR